MITHTTKILKKSIRADMAVLALLLIGAVVSFDAYGQDSSANCLGNDDLILDNGKIVTMDADGSLATAVRIRGDRIIAVESVGESECARVIDLGGRTVIPGLIDSHLHLARQGNAPGHDTRRAESATTVDALLTILAAKSQAVPTAEFITVIGGIEPEQFAENRMPTLAELDRALPLHATYIQQGFLGPAWTNSRGIEFLRQHDVPVNEEGTIAAGDDTNAAFAALSAQQTFADKVRGTRELMSFANSLGLTMVVDQGGTPFPGASFFDLKNDYQAIVELWRQADMPLRVRIQHTGSERSADRGLFEEKLENTYPLFGDDMLRFTGTGEHVVTFPRDGEVNPAYEAKIAVAAALGWSHEQHSVSNSENSQHLQMIGRVHAENPIDELRWALSHVFELGTPGTENLVRMIKSMQMGVRVQGQAFMLPTDRFPLGRTMGGENAGPLYRTLLDNDIAMGGGTDGALLVPMNPWFAIYYAVTGRDNAGRLINPNETLSRQEALSLYTIDNAWFSFDEDALGSIEAGKLADIVVLNEDYLTVPEERIRELGSVLTIVNGDVVYAAEEFSEFDF